ncbi:hypothetical protein NEOLEDRAFT_534743 [Neolentinus lepideus HHB14362 ss-1]|uniref:Uncharacterized protein n=1 Tax=Neolentinus lepideus HHB14362 ss-1 TaxID=1314782 RepID=A0A165RAB5_9AGAM|nr:hypothetical protein NEOLEDRAFT_534743 [Neolentinus lepideus HHB14362 ss-1]
MRKAVAWVIGGNLYSDCRIYLRYAVYTFTERRAFSFSSCSRISSMASAHRPSVSSSSTREPLLDRSHQKDSWEASLESDAWEYGSTYTQSAFSVSFADSDSTISNRPGLGLTLDKPLRKAGAKVVHLISRVSEDLGRGPNALMGRMLTSGKWGTYPCHNLYCRIHQDSLGPSILWSSPSVENVLDILFSPYCPKCRDYYSESLMRSEVFVDGCRKLVQGVRENNQSALRLCAHYVGALSYFHPSFRCHFLKLKADDALRELQGHYMLWEQYLLARHATGALASLTETVILPVIKTFDQLKRKVDQYFPHPLSQHDLSAIEHQTCECVSKLLQGLNNPDHQILAAYHLSLALVLSYHGLTQMTAPLARALNATTIDWLWQQLLHSDDPVARGVLGRLLCNLYDFLSYAAFTSNWNAEVEVPAGVWLWRTLWVPFFDLKDDFNLAATAQKLVVRRVCKVFFRWSRSAASICYEARDEIEEMLKKPKPSTPSSKHGRMSRDRISPITVLMQKIESPLFRLAATLEKDRRISESPHLHEIDRAISPRLLSEVSEGIADAVFK